MKKIPIILLIITMIVSNTLTFATGTSSSSVSGNNTSNNTAAHARTTNSSTPTQSSGVTANATPSIEPPMIFTVSTTDGASSLVLSDIANTAVKLVFKIAPKNEGFSESFTILKIVNSSTKYIYDYNKKIEKNEKEWTYPTDVTFTNTDIGNSVTFELYWKDFAGNERVEKAQIKIEEPIHQLDIKAETDGPIVPGLPVKIRYTIKNTGNVTLKNVLLSDDTVSYLNGGEPFTSEEFLVPNATLIKTASIIVDGEITLSPQVSFTYKNGTKTIKGKDVTLTAQDVIPTISLTCDNYIVEQKGSANTFNYTITNTTQVPLTNILIYDSDADDARLVDTVQLLDVGQTHTGSYELTVTKSGYYKFKIHYNYQGADMDKQQFAKTDKPIKLPNEVFFDIIKVSPESLPGPGKMTFTVLVENDTLDELRNLTLSEANNLFERKVLNNIVVSAALGGKKGTFEYEFTVDVPAGTRQMQLILNYVINGEAAVLTANRDIIITESYTMAPTETATPTIGVDTSQDQSGIVIWIWVCVFILLFIITLIIILIIVRNSLKKKTEPVSVKRKVTNTFDDSDITDDFDEYGDSTEDDSIAFGDIDEDIMSEATIIKSTDIIDEEFAEEFNDDYDDEGVKIYKSKK